MTLAQFWTLVAAIGFVGAAAGLALVRPMRWVLVISDEIRADIQKLLRIAWK